jgi:Skp family chaperone for outer membrane proteins
MKRIMTITLLSAGALFVGGCDQQSTSMQTLVVDPVPVAKSIGRDELMQKQLDSAIEQLNAQVRQHSSGLSIKVEQEKEKLGKKPSDASAEQFRELVAAASESIKQTQMLARQKAADYRASLLDEFNAELRAAAADIAKQRGASNVLVVDDSLLWFDPDTDITADVIAKLRAKASADNTPSSAADASEKREMEKLEAVVESIEEQEQAAP